MSNPTRFQMQIGSMLPHIQLRYAEPLARHTSFRIGGPAEVMAFPESREQLAELLKVSTLLDCEPVILGSGTNILAPDEGLPGLVICLKDGLRDLNRIDDTDIYVGSGVSMTKAAVFAEGLGLSGLEFAHGIPGSVGGGVYMNAGAYGGEIGDICKYVDVMERDGTVRRLESPDMGFAYRKSNLMGTDSIILGAAFTLVPGDPDQIRRKMQELQQKRRASQPLEYPSAGSAFKRPVGGYAAALIDQAGLKGFSIGGAAVSEKHAGFVINLGGASAADVRALLDEVAGIVMEKSGIYLEPEIRIL